MKNRANPYAKPDAKTLEARAKGYPARSVFKLQEIDRRMRVLRAGQNVLDLGAAPGSWSLFASERVGPTGHVYAIDIKPILQAFGTNVHVLEGDALSLDSALLTAHAPYDVVLSDMAPKTSGIKMRDQAASFELFERALAVARTFGKPETSAFVVKIFMGPEFNEAVALTKNAFSKSRVIRPEGTRQNSKEVFLVGQGLRPVALDGTRLERADLDATIPGGAPVPPATPDET